jgi:periplasmic protein CpxP/Spy
MKVIAAILVSTFVAGAAVAQTPDPSAGSRAPANATPSAMAKSDARRDNAVEQHISALHAQLGITAAEESQWKVVAETMRENAKDLDHAIDARDSSVATATAIDNLNSYAEIAQAHASGVKKLASAFAGLYSAMSGDQQKEADEVFSHRGHDAKKIASR